jgi:hypothetical protein
MSNIDVAAIAARTKLTTLRTGLWGATRLHRGETRAENARHNTNAARVTVRVTDHHALHDLGKLHAAAYTAHKSITLPTVQDGIRLLPAGRELEHADLMSKYADKHHEIVREFLNDYDAERAAAPARLNGLFDASMWPPHAVMVEKFTFKTRYLPTPSDGAWGDWLVESGRAAEDDLRDRLTEALERVRDRCSSDGKLYATVFDSIRDLTGLVPDLDLTGSFAPVVQAMAPLTTLHAEVLRDDTEGRKQAADRASSILSVLGRIS